MVPDIFPSSTYDENRLWRRNYAQPARREVVAEPESAPVQQSQESAVAEPSGGVREARLKQAADLFSIDRLGRELRPLVTILNLPGRIQPFERTHHTVSYLEGDACEVDGVRDGEFEIVFSNCVIEHVGSDDRQRAFASEVRRVGKKFWVQTPSKWFPIEAHCGMPFWWFYPETLRRAFQRGWRKKLPAWTEAVENTRVLTRRQLIDLFPEAKIKVERFAGLSKSYVVYCQGK